MTKYDLLRWLSESDSSAYGECHGPLLDELVADGLVALGPVPPGKDMEYYRRVSLTEQGWAELPKVRK